jgi:DDE superfamily endonuclease
MPDITPIFLPSRAPELNPVENVWQYLRQNWLSNAVFENYDAIIDAACAVWRKLITQPETITSIGMGDCADVGQPLTLVLRMSWAGWLRIDFTRHCVPKTVVACPPFFAKRRLRGRNRLLGELVQPFVCTAEGHPTGVMGNDRRR